MPCLEVENLIAHPLLFFSFPKKHLAMSRLRKLCKWSVYGTFFRDVTVTIGVTVEKKSFTHTVYSSKIV